MAFRKAYLVCSIVVAVTAVVPPVILEDTNAVLIADTTTCLTEGHGGSFQHNGGALNDDVMTFAEYHFEPEESGCYLIEEYHPVLSGDCVDFSPQSVPIKINFCKNLTTMGYINQGTNGGTWNKLTTLPFYKGWSASIEITREDLNGRMTACDSSGCFWMADAFRLSYVASDCRDPSVREIMQRDDHTTVAGSANEAVQLDRAATSTVQTSKTSTTTTAEQRLAVAIVQTLAETEEPSSEAEQPRMVLEALLTDATAEDEDASFVFQPPVDGCYLIEEKHPPVHGLDAAPLTVNFCKGMSAVGAIDHTDGRHDRWNYVASLPFYAGKEGRMVFPKHVVFADSSDGGKRSHSFRLTHVGARCHVAEAATHHMTVRITADFAHVTDRLTAFGQELLELIAGAAGSLAERLYMTDLRAGSIVAQLTVRPAAAVHGFEEAVGKETSASISRKIEQSVATPDLTSKLCNLVGPSLNDCSVSVVASSVARPQVEVVQPPRGETSTEEVVQEVAEDSGSMMDHIGIIIGGAVGAVIVCVGLLVLCRCRRQQAMNQQSGDNKLAVEAEKLSTDTAKVEEVKLNAECPAVQKDAEKDGHSDDASTVTPVEQRDEVAAAGPGDADSGDGSQASPTAEQV